MFQCLVAFILLIPLLTQAHAVKDVKRPGKIGQKLLVIPSGWAAKIPPKGKVNAPGQLNELAPGQKFAVAVLAHGDGHEHLLQNIALNMKIKTGGGLVKKQRLKPIAIRQVKASGLDQVLRVLDVGGIKTEHKDFIEKAGSMVSIAVFEASLEAPVSSKEQTIHIEASITGDTAHPPSIEPIDLKVRPWSDWQKSEEPDGSALDKFVRDFHKSPQPGRLLPMLGAAIRSKAFEQPTVLGFFVAAFQEYPLARQEAVNALPSLDPLLKWALLLVLRLNGRDISGMVGGLPEDAVRALQESRPLKDPRTTSSFTDPVDPQAVMDIGFSMDHWWGGWMATGDSSYLRALIELLGGARDYPALQEWTKTKGGATGFNAAVARGIAYQVVGWSLSSFQYSDPQVADWLQYWQQDTDIPPLIREQIRTLPDNPAFRKNNQ